VLCIKLIRAAENRKKKQKWILQRETHVKHIRVNKFPFTPSEESALTLYFYKFI